MNVLVFHCLYHSLKVFFEEKQYFFADLPPNSAFPNLTLDARSSVIYNLYGHTGQQFIRPRCPRMLRQ